MKIDIIDDDYFSKHKYYQIGRWFLVLIFITNLLILLDLIELPKLYDFIFNIALFIAFLTLALSGLIFTRIGKLELVENILISRIDDSIQTIELDTIKTVKISSTNKNHYFMKFDPNFEVLIEMKNGQLDEIKKVFIKNKIEIIETSLISRLKNWFTKQ